MQASFIDSIVTYIFSCSLKSILQVPFNYIYASSHIFSYYLMVLNQNVGSEGACKSCSSPTNKPRIDQNGYMLKKKFLSFTGIYDIYDDNLYPYLRHVLTYASNSLMSLL
jgi:hypothetical protein